MSVFDVTSASTQDEIVLYLVVLLRLAAPLLIPRFPVPGILACLVIDAVDQTIFQTFTDLDVAGSLLSYYEDYDKAFDIYYLAVAYISTMRNWTSRPAYYISSFLFYYRLVGALLFEISETRAVLLIFPNTFEYFFIFYELVRLRWDPAKRSARFWLCSAAVIWVVIKLPQEYWIHIAKLDVTAEVEANPLLGVAGAAILLLLAGVFWFVIRPRLPKPDWPLRLAADPIPAAIDEERERRALLAQGRLLSGDLLERVVLVSFVCVIFAHVFPAGESSDFQLAVGTAVVVVANTALLINLGRRGRGGIESPMLGFLVLFAMNVGLAIVYNDLFLSGVGFFRIENPLLFLFLLTLILTLFNRYRPVHEVRFGRTPQAEASPA